MVIENTLYSIHLSLHRYLIARFLDVQEGKPDTDLQVFPFSFKQYANISHKDRIIEKILFSFSIQENSVLSPKKILQEINSYRIINYIGLGGFEPPTPCPPDMYAKPLRYSPNSIGYPTGRNIIMKGFLCQ